ncbi:MAG: hypothetical protein IJI24_02915 [Lachnospiraceae bacterium]|nr:hypothetical protein [Lachnospiraceae bacterium]
MKRIQNFEVILDADDVLLDCNRYALNLLSQADGVPYSIDRVTDWGLLGIPEDRRLDFLNRRDFYQNQPPLPGAREFLHNLMQICNVTIMTAVYPQFMGERIQRISTLFPEFPMENIIMGKRKEMLTADVILDDGIHNLLHTGSTLPVLFRQPWNRHVSGICSVNYYNEFLSLIQIMTGNRRDKSRVPKVICIVGPSGSGKHELSDELCTSDSFVRIRTCTTALHAGKNTTLRAEEFEEKARSGFFLETTYYCQERYGLPLADIENALSSGKHAVAVMDISGCMAVQNRYPGQNLIIYTDRNKRDCIASILDKSGLKSEHAVDRILSFDFEEKNKILADEIVTISGDNSFTQAAERIRSVLEEIPKDT